MNPAALIPGLVQARQQAIAAGQEPGDIQQKLAEAVSGNVAADIPAPTADAITALVSDDPTTVLDACLATIMHADMTGTGDDTIAAVWSALQADAGLQAAAQARLNSITALAANCGNNLGARDWLSARHAKWLAQALAL